MCDTMHIIILRRAFCCLYIDTEVFELKSYIRMLKHADSKQVQFL